MPDKPTVELSPIEVAALLHEAAPAADGDCETVEMVPLVELADEPPRLARGSDAVQPAAPAVAPAQPAVARPRRTRVQLRVSDVIPDEPDEA